jgi:quinol monooxygenase YgiN
MVVTIIRHRVADFSAWKQSYDSVADVQREGGVRSQSVLISLDDPNVVVVTHSFDDAAAARAFFDREDLKAAMVGGGVDLGTLSLEFLDEVQSGTL